MASCDEEGRRQVRQPRRLIDSGHIVCGRNGADEPAFSRPLTPGYTEKRWKHLQLKLHQESIDCSTDYLRSWFSST